MTFTEAAATVGVDAEAIELNQVELADLQNATHFVVVLLDLRRWRVPRQRGAVLEAISADDADRLEHLSFAVLALGDISLRTLLQRRQAPR